MKLVYGLLVYKDNKDETWEDFIKNSASLYENKLGFMPTHCHISPETEEINENLVNLVIIRDGKIMHNHCWLGVPDVTEKPS